MPEKSQEELDYIEQCKQEALEKENQEYARLQREKREQAELAKKIRLMRLKEHLDHLNRLPYAKEFEPLLAPPKTIQMNRPHIELLTPSDACWALWHGQAGDLKSTFAREFALHASAGKDFLGTKIPHPALVISLLSENAAETAAIAKQLNQFYFGKEEHPYQHLDVIIANNMDSYSDFRVRPNEDVEELLDQKMRKHFEMISKLILEQYLKVHEHLSNNPHLKSPQEIILIWDHISNYYPRMMDDTFVFALSREIKRFCQTIQGLTGLKTSVVTVCHTVSYAGSDKVKGSADFVRLASYSMKLTKTVKGAQYLLQCDFENSKFKNAKAPKLPLMNFISKDGVLTMEESKFYRYTGAKNKDYPMDAHEYVNNASPQSMWTAYLKLLDEITRIRSAIKLEHLQAIFQEALFHDAHKSRDDFIKCLDIDKNGYYSREQVNRRAVQRLGDLYNKNVFDAAWRVIFREMSTCLLVTPFQERAKKALEQHLCVCLSVKHPMLARVGAKISNDR